MLADALSLSAFHARSIWNWRTLYYGRLVEPILYYILLIVGLDGIVDPVNYRGTTLQYSSFALPGVTALVCLRMWASILQDVANDKKWGVYGLARLNGIGLGQYAISINLVSTVIGMAQVLVLVLLGSLATDLRLSVAVSLMLVTVPVLIFWSTLGVALGLLINTYSQRDLVLSFSVLPVVFSAPLFYLINDDTPAYLVFLAKINPMTYNVELMRDAYVSRLDWQGLVLVAAMIAVASALVRLIASRVELLSDETG